MDKKAYLKSIGLRKKNGVVGGDSSTGSTRAVALFPWADQPDKQWVIGKGLSMTRIEDPDPRVQEQDARQVFPRWRQALVDLEGRLPEGAVMSAMDFSVQQHSMAGYLPDGSPATNLMLWCDGRAAEFRDAITKFAGWPLPSGFMASKLYWLGQKRPEIMAAVKHYRQVATILTVGLTGYEVIGATEAGSNGLPLNLDLWEFDEAGLAQIDSMLIGKLPQVLLPGRFCPNGLKPELARRFKSGAFPPGMFVGGGISDNAASGIPNLAAGEGVFTASAGTSGTIFGIAPEFDFDPQGAGLRMLAPTGQTQVLACIENCGKVNDWVAEQWAIKQHGRKPKKSEAEAWRREALDALEAASEKLPRGCGGKAACLPFFGPDRLPLITKPEVVWSGLTPEQMDDWVLRFLLGMQGFTMNLVLCGLDRMKELGIGIKRLVLVGGHAKHSRQWCQMMADLSDLECTVVADSAHAACKGAAIHALWCLLRAKHPELPLAEVASWFANFGETFKPNAENQELYRPAIAAHRAALAELLKKQ